MYSNPLGFRFWLRFVFSLVTLTGNIMNYSFGKTASYTRHDFLHHLQNQRKYVSVVGSEHTSLLEISFLDHNLEGWRCWLAGPSLCSSDQDEVFPVFSSGR